MSGDSQETFEQTGEVTERQFKDCDDDPENIINDVERNVPKACPDLLTLPAELRTALEAILHVQSSTVEFTTTDYPYGRLWMWADDSRRTRRTSVRWDAKYPISITLDQPSVRRVAKALKTMGGRLGRYANQHGLVIGDVAIPWAKDLRPTPPNHYFGNDAYFTLDREMLRQLKPSKLLTLTRDFPEKTLRILTDTGRPALHLASFNPWPREDLESQFMVTDVGLLAGPGKNPVNVYCDCSDIEGKLLLTSSVPLCGDWDITVLTTITGSACPHPPRYVAQPDAYELAGLDVEPDEPKSMSRADSERPIPQELSEDGSERSLAPQEPLHEGQVDPPTSTRTVEIMSNVGEQLTNDRLANVGCDGVSADIGFAELMALADVGTPDDSATCDELVEQVKLLAEVLGALELTFNIRMAKLLSRAKRVYGGEGKFEDYAARQLNCSPRTVYRLVLVGREISETDYSRIPPPFRKLQYLTIIASGLKKGETFVDLVEELETELEGDEEVGDLPGSTPDGEANGDSNSTDAAKNTGSEPEPVAPNPKPQSLKDCPKIRSEPVRLGEPLRLTSRKGSVEVTITRILVPRTIVEESLKSIEGDMLVLGGFTAFVDVDLKTR